MRKTNQEQNNLIYVASNIWNDLLDSLWASENLRTNKQWGKHLRWTMRKTAQTVILNHFKVISFYVTAFTDINICLFKVLPFYFHIVTGLIWLLQVSTVSVRRFFFMHGNFINHILSLYSIFFVFVICIVYEQAVISALKEITNSHPYVQPS